MKLSLLCERKVEGYRYFHGTQNYKTLSQMLNGISGNCYWARNPGLALAYATQHPNGISKQDDCDHCYLLEAQINIQNKTLHGDEDSIAIGEAPSCVRDANDPRWVNWFQQWWPELPREQWQAFVNEYSPCGDVPRKWAKWVPLAKDSIRAGDIQGTHLNIVTSKVGLRGPSRIVAGYSLIKHPGRRGWGDLRWIVERIVYDNGASFMVGDVIEAWHEYQQ